MPSRLNPASQPAGPGKRGILVACLILVAVILGVYFQTANFAFVNVDDPDYVTSNLHVATGITPGNLAWALTSVDAANWHPLTWLSHQLDVQLYGMDPGGHHLTNVALHAATSLLLLLLLLRFDGSLWRSSFIAFLFALHPLHVESVAWVAERKDVLSAFFWMATLLCYFGFAREGRKPLYLLALLSFALGLMCKPMLVTLPLVLLLMDFWPLRRLAAKEAAPELVPVSGRLRPLILEKIPFFALSLASCAMTIYAQHHGGATRSLAEIPLVLRLENAAVAYLKYLGKTLWPSDLAVLYLFPDSIPLWQPLVSLLVLVLISWGCLRARRGHPYLAVGWFWFLITLIPVIGLVQVGTQSMADRYMYLPLVGLGIMAAWGASDLLKNLRYRSEVLGTLAVAALLILAAVTWNQVGYWRNSITLCSRALEVDPANYLIRYNLADALETRGALDAAIREYQETIRINPRYEGAHINLGAALDTRGDYQGAIREYREALRINPANAKTRNNLGVALQSVGDLAGAVRELQEAIRLKPDYAKAHYHLGLALEQGGNLPAAQQEYQEALRIDPRFEQARRKLAGRRGQ